MARHFRSSKLETAAARRRLPMVKKPVFVTISPGIALGYRRNRSAGTWVIRATDGHGGTWTKAFGLADDYEDADGEHVLTFWRAQDKARAIARGRDVESARPNTVAEALDDYEASLRARGADPENARRARFHLTPILLSKPVALLTARELSEWRDGLKLRPATLNRTLVGLRAALNWASSHDPRIANHAAWRIGLAALSDAYTSRNVILSDSTVLALVGAAWSLDSGFGLLVEVLAVTGARFSQLARLTAGDLQAGNAPRLMMPRSAKGRAKKAGERRPVPISQSLAQKLLQAAGDRSPSAPLLVRSDAAPWGRIHRKLFAAICTQLGLPSRVTPYALRHSAIVRALLAGVPIRVVAVNHDTSVMMIERTYSRHISDHSDAVARRALLDPAVPPDDDNVVTLPMVRP